jgi:hypothetical protein
MSHWVTWANVMTVARVAMTRSRNRRLELATMIAITTSSSAFRRRASRRRAASRRRGACRPRASRPSAASRPAPHARGRRLDRAHVGEEHALEAGSDRPHCLVERLALLDLDHAAHVRDLERAAHVVEVVQVERRVLDRELDVFVVAGLADQLDERRPRSTGRGCPAWARPRRGVRGVGCGAWSVSCRGQGSSSMSRHARRLATRRSIRVSQPVAREPPSRRSCPAPGRRRPRRGPPAAAA